MGCPSKIYSAPFPSLSHKTKSLLTSPIGCATKMNKLAKLKRFVIRKTYWHSLGVPISMFYIFLKSTNVFLSLFKQTFLVSCNIKVNVEWKQFFSRVSLLNKLVVDRTIPRPTHHPPPLFCNILTTLTIFLTTLFLEYLYNVV